MNLNLTPAVFLGARDLRSLYCEALGTPLQASTEEPTSQTTLNPKALNPKTLNPKTLNPQP